MRRTAPVTASSKQWSAERIVREQMSSNRMAPWVPCLTAECGVRGPRLGYVGGASRPGVAPRRPVAVDAPLGIELDRRASTADGDSTRLVFDRMLIQSASLSIDIACGVRQRASCVDAQQRHTIYRS